MAQRIDREPFEGGSYDDGDTGEELGAELLGGKIYFMRGGSIEFSDVGDFTSFELIGDVGRDPFEGVQLND